MFPDPIIGPIHWYGVMIAIGIGCAVAVLFWLGKKTGMDPKFTDFVYGNSIFAVFAGFGSAALFQSFYEYLENPSGGFHISGNITFIGGLIGGVGLFILIYICRHGRYNGNMWQIMDIAPSCILLAHGFGRIGCFMAGCCYGKETDSIFGVQFPGLSHPVYPTQLYEAVFLFLMFFVCTWLLLQKHYRHNTALYLVSYGIFRFLIEFIRGDDRGQLTGGLSPSQFWSLLFIVCGVVLYYLRRKSLQRETAMAAAAPGEINEAEKIPEE